MTDTTLNQSLDKVAIIGAAGKMGKGIALLLLQEMATLEASIHGKVGSGKYQLFLIDTNEKQFPELRSFLKKQLLRFAEKNINLLRSYYSKDQRLISNEEIIDAFVEGSMDLIFLETDINKAKDAKLVFEAALEDVEEKAKIFKSISESSKSKPYFLTNTSSIPIHLLNEKANLNGKIIGFHFYNPPQVQKLVEIIVPEKIDSNLTEIAKNLGKRLGKTIVFSKDIAGFIGNGHFLREISVACEKVNELGKTKPITEAIYIVNKVTQEYLIRPMGIFQLLDYVGLDICQKISKIMKLYLPNEHFDYELIDQMVAQGIKGGQNPDGSQKNGFFQYENNIPIGIYSLKDKQYFPLKDASWKTACDSELGKLPKSHIPWKKLVNDPQKQQKLSEYFHQLFEDNALGSQLAKYFLSKSRAIAQKLIEDGVAEDISDVTTVLENGFYHLYGPESIVLEEFFV